MRKLLGLLLLLIPALSQNALAQQVDTSYSREWLDIDTTLSLNQLPRTALDKVNLLYQKALKANLGPQQLKCILYKMTLEELVNERVDLSAIRVLNKEIELQKDPLTRMVLHTLFAKQLFRYYEDNRWTIQNRNQQGVAPTSGDISRWGSNDFDNAIRLAYKKALLQPALLKPMPVSAIKAVILPGTGPVQPDNWLELILLEKIAYFKNPVPRNPLIVSGKDYLPNAFTDPEAFVKISFPQKDSSSEVTVLKDYQLLIQAALDKKQVEKLVGLQIDKINWAWSELTPKEKYQTVYQQALFAVILKYPDQTATLQAYYLQAKQELQVEKNYNHSPNQKNGYLAAEQLLTQALSKSTRTLPEIDAIKKLLATIQQPKLRIQTESVYLPNQPILSLVNYTNTPRVYFSIVSLNMNEWEKYAADNKETDGALLKKVAIQEKKWELPASGDRRNHSTEVMINPLSPGKYAIIASSMLDLNNNECVISVSTFQVSAIAALQQNNQWLAVNRSNGEPLANADFQFYSSSWSSKGTVYQRIQAAKGKTDANGQFKLDNQSGNIGGVSIRNGQDELFLGNIYNNIEPSFRENTKELEAINEQYILLTDRSIYRPGQTVYWKAIKYLENKNTQSSKVAAEGTKLTLYLRDPNNQIIDSITGSLNSFGSCSGQFLLPRNRINGTFRLDVEGQRKHTVSIQVEEYKRPRFAIEWNKQKGNYGMQDTLSVIGKAVSFSGYNVGKAIVRYQVIRQERFIPYYRSSRRKNMNRTEIVSGNTETDATGNFKISFKPVADAEDISDENQFYTYEITATITDIGGESQTGTTSLPVSRRSVFANWQLPNMLTEKEWKKAQLFTTNLSNEFTPTLLTVRIDALQAPDKLGRERYWSLPDQYVMSEQEFKTNFPNDVYSNENKPENWPVLQAISTDNFISQPNGKNPVTEQKLSAGYYRITTTYFDSTSGKTIQDIQHTRLVQNHQQATTTTAQLPYTFQANQEVIVGDTLEAFLFTGKSILLHSFQLSPATDTLILEKKLIKEGIDPFSVKATMPGTYQYHTCYINNNRVFEHTFEWTILPVSHPLTIKTTSFRDHLLPGNQEKWTLEITDTANRTSPAELVSSLYDASLDQFRWHEWYLPQTYVPGIFRVNFNFQHNFRSESSYVYYAPEINYRNYPTQIPSRLAEDAYELYNQQRERRINGQKRVLPYFYGPLKGELNEVVVAYDQAPANQVYDKKFTPVSPELTLKIRGTNTIKTADDNSILTSNNPAGKKEIEFPAFEARKNLSETGFFLPHVYANEKGVYSIEFTVPESLTKWKWLNWAHTRDMSVGLLQKEVFTQKPLMVITQLPRFLREGDQLELSAQIANPGDSELTGQVMLELIDGDTEKPVDGWFQNVFPVQYFTVAAGKTHPVKFPIQIPFGYNRPLLIRIKAFSGQFSDGEQQLLPVITQRTLVTESKSFWMKNDASLSLSFPTLLNNTSGTLTHESIQLEVATQPAWYIVKALPYLLENNNPTAEQVSNRLFANQLSFHILQQFPAIKKVIEQWKKDTTALQSKLSSSPQLQSLLQEETPWLQESADEQIQMKNLGKLLDSARMMEELAILPQQLASFQLPSGGFSWMKGGSADEYTTLYILDGLRKLDQLQAWIPEIHQNVKPQIQPAIRYMDSLLHLYFMKDYVVTSKSNNKIIAPNWIDYLQLRKHFSNIPAQFPVDLPQLEKEVLPNWRKYNQQLQAKVASIMIVGLQKDTAVQKIIPSLMEKAVRDSIQGMYWKYAGYTGGFESPLSMQTNMLLLLSEAGSAITSKYQQEVAEMIRWVIQQKKSNHWATTPATAEACYALLKSLPANYLSNPARKVTFQVGAQTFQISPEQAEAGTGFYRQRIDGKKVSSAMGTITCTVTSENKSTTQSLSSAPVMGSIYYQYLENLNNVKGSSHPALSVEKVLYLQKDSLQSKQLVPLQSLTPLRRGDRIICRLIITCKQPMDYVFLKDMRGSGTEPTDVISNYRWQDGVGYYQTTRDAHTGFFFRHLNKGTFIIDYSINITHIGSFAAGLANIECLYAPEYRSHSNNTNMRVAE